ncbi:MAG TPA: YraN family protein [Actinomycetota bacterium]|nr:YraN family protein [Actinomycetota bacterium]
MDDRKHVGRSGELAAWEAYRRRGYRLVARNWRCPLGELDLVVGRPGLIVFCEVKTRRPGPLGEPFEAVTPAKQRKLRKLGQAFLFAQATRPPACRFDVASVTVDGSGRAEVQVYEDAF